ncbi:MAG: DUF362 domain-containing protein [Elusimicrobiaceae bacterium]|nr:DUF362 domain-containing protein [Elusimicrobiaceae bacterium]
MKSKVYFADARSQGWRNSMPAKLEKLFDAADFSACIPAAGLVAVKMHFGELGGHLFVNPVFARAVVDKVKHCGGQPFLSDTNTLYSGSRKNAVVHARTASLHGFGPAVTDAPVVIADGLLGRDERLVEIGLKHFKQARVASAFVEADALVVLSHFKGHIMAGFGGSIKNLAMGCASVAGKREQHSTRQQVVPEKCAGCGLCAEACPEKAISVSGRKAFIARELCIGCGECMTVCPQGAIDLDWATDIGEFSERLTEYAYAAAKPFAQKGRAAYFNFLLNITPECDCVPWSDAPIVPDIGVLASKDPVALDQASFDLVRDSAGLQNTALHAGHACGQDKFKALAGNTMPEAPLAYGEKIGLGSRAYELIRL